MAEHVPSACGQCGQVDDHPKIHYGVDSFHHDCAPANVRPTFTGVLPAIVAAAESGTRGDALRAHIAALHEGSA